MARKRIRRRNADKRKAINAAESSPFQRATCERLARARGQAAIGADGVQYMRDGHIERMAAHGLLCPGNKGRNHALFTCAARFQKLWDIAGLQGSPTTINLLSPGGGQGAFRTPITERQTEARDAIRFVNAKLPDPIWRVVLAIVIEDMPAVDAGRIHTCYKQVEQARAVATDRLRTGLDIIADGWGY